MGHGLVASSGMIIETRQLEAVVVERGARRVDVQAPPPSVRGEKLVRAQRGLVAVGAEPAVALVGDFRDDPAPEIVGRVAMKMTKELSMSIDVDEVLV